MSFEFEHPQHARNIVLKSGSIAAGIAKLNNDHSVLLASSDAHGIVDALQARLAENADAVFADTGVRVDEVLAAINAMVALKIAYETVDTSAIRALAYHPFMPNMH